METSLIVYMVMAVIATVYQGYRGFRFQWILGIKEVKSTWDRILLLCIADMILYAVCSAAGFAALWQAYDIYTHIPTLAEISTSATVLLLSLSLFGLIGVTGQLPPLIQLGKLLPGISGNS
jgi:hypothetical protein